MDLTPLPFQTTLHGYREQAGALLAAWRAGDPSALEIVRHKHPRFVNPAVPWLPKRLSDEEVRRERFELPDAELTVARAYDFENWARLAEHVRSVADEGSAVWRFESAVEAAVHGDLATLEPLLHGHPDLVHARSSRVTHFDPPVHAATLLHYIAANGVEAHRQKTPPNALAVASMLLRAGAAPDALAGMYGGQHTTMSMLVSSEHPARAGLQVGLIDTLVDFGAAVEAGGSGDWASPLMTALAFGYIEAAEALVRRGARVATLAAAAGLGRVSEARVLLATASPEDRHRGLVLAAQRGRADILRMLLDAGEDPNRYNPRGNHDHSTPLHQAVFAGHEEVVRLLVSRGARMDIKDRIYESTPLGWALYGGRDVIAEYLRTQGAGS